MRRITRAIISVSDKNGVIEFAKTLQNLGVEILSTGGTAKLLKDNKIKVIPISEYTGYPEILDGRVKTLNPIIHGGILGKVSDKKHKAEMDANKISPIDLIVVNLYPFEETISKTGVTLEDAIENIDIGGPTMLRAAAKNFEEVTVIVDPSDYSAILTELKDNNCVINRDIRLNLAKKVFSHTARYDSLIAKYLEGITGGDKFPEIANIRLQKIQTLRYGENPHQSAAFYREIGAGKKGGIGGAEKLHGKELSFNNIVDIDSALKVVSEFDSFASVIIKHTNPCGVAVSNSSLLEAYKTAREADPVSAFGGVIGFNKTVDAPTAKDIVTTFVEAIIAPDYEPEALGILKTKKNMMILKSPLIKGDSIGELDIKKVSGGVLLQDENIIDIDKDKLRVVTKRHPTDTEFKDILFAWKVAKHVKSNAIVYASGEESIGIGAGQMSRIDSAKIASFKARKPLKGAVMASDAFFPFRDNIDEAAKAGITAIVQPGGSIKDSEVIAAADEHNIAMVFTGIRHFKH